MVPWRIICQNMQYYWQKKSTLIQINFSCSLNSATVKSGGFSQTTTHLMWIFKSIMRNDAIYWSISCDSAPRCIIHTSYVDMPLVRRLDNHHSCTIAPLLITWHIASKCQALHILQNVQETVLLTEIQIMLQPAFVTKCTVCFHILSLLRLLVQIDTGLYIAQLHTWWACPCRNILHLQ